MIGHSQSSGEEVISASTVYAGNVLRAFSLQCIGLLHAAEKIKSPMNNVTVMQIQKEKLPSRVAAIDLCWKCFALRLLFIAACH